MHALTHVPAHLATCPPARRFAPQCCAHTPPVPARARRLVVAAAGRAGRREQSSVSIYVAFDSPLDQYMMAHPDHLFRRPVEHAQARACMHALRA